MIKLSRLNGAEFVLNCDLIETVEEKPDTVICTTTGKKYIVKETQDEIISKVIEYKNSIISEKKGV